MAKEIKFNIDARDELKKRQHPFSIHLGHRS